MPRPKNAVPQPRQHKGRAVLDVYENGTRRTRTLGAWGSPEAQAEYKRFLVDFASGKPAVARGSDLTLNEALLAYLHFAGTHYRHTDGTHTSEVWCIRMALKPLRELYGHTLAREFGPRALKTLREHMVGLRWVRKQVNAAVERVRRFFKWAATDRRGEPSCTVAELSHASMLQFGRD